MESNMIKYYLDWMNESENPKTNKYCNDMINKLSGAVIHAEKYGKRKKILVQVDQHKRKQFENVHFYT